MPTKDSVLKTARMRKEDWVTILGAMERYRVSYSGLMRIYANDLRGKPTWMAPEARSFKMEKLKTENAALKKEVELLNDKLGLKPGIYIKETKPDYAMKLEKLASESGTTAERIVSDLEHKKKSGRLTITGKGITANDTCPFDWVSFTEACDEMGRDYNDTMERLIQTIYKE